MTFRAAVVSALLLTAAAPPSPVPLLVLGALVPLALTLPRGSALQAARAGALFFAVHWGLLLLWIPRAGLRVGPWTLAAWLALVLTMSLLGALFGRLYHHLAGAARLPLGPALALAWMTVEIGRGTLLGPLNFPWMGIAVPLAAHPPLVQGAAWVGEAGVATAVVAANGLLAGAVRGARPGAPSRRRVAGVAVAPLAALGLGLAGVHLAGSVRIARAVPETVATLVAVQPAVSLEVKRGPDALAASFAGVEALLPAVRTAVERSTADAVVLPETALPADVDRVSPILAHWARSTGVPVVAGVEGRRGGRRSNAVVVATPGVPSSDWPLAHKVRLVPGVEWSPLPGRGWARGSEPGLLRVAGFTVAPLVCIESAGPRPARDQVARGADLLVNVTNDAWLAEGPPATRSRAFHQHPAHLVLRAVETGRGALRVGNNGLTEVVDPLGRRRLLLEPHRPGVASARVERLAGRTPFVAGGWAAGWLVLGATLLASLRPLRLPRRAPYR